MTQVTFKVSMNDEEKKAGNAKEVKLNVDMSKATREELEIAALKSYVIKIQGEFRPNWDKFMAGDYPRDITYGQVLFAKKATRVMTEAEKVAAYKSDALAMSETERLDKLFMDGLITEEMYDMLIKVAVAKEEAEGGEV